MNLASYPETTMERPQSILDTCQELLDGQVPNFLRLHVNPHVAQTCLCLARYVTTSWPDDSGESAYQSFLANGRDEAISGAIKLARYVRFRPSDAVTGILIDPAGELSYLESMRIADDTLALIPDLRRWPADVEPLADWLGKIATASYVVVASRAVSRMHERDRKALVAWLSRAAPLVIRCVDRATLDLIRAGEVERLDERRPDIVVFDESFVRRETPFAAFTARRSLYGHWNRRGRATFHSTTFQPNAVSSLHFLRCLACDDRPFMDSVATELAAIRESPRQRADVYRKLYSPSLERLNRVAGFSRGPVRAAGHFVHVGATRYLDLVAGVACSLRGHNPPHYVAEMTSLAETMTDDECVSELGERLQELTGLEHMLPAVSGASAVENALKLALAAQAPRKHVLVLSGGYGGKTLLALATTASASLKQRLGPLYPHVINVDPFAPDAVQRIDEVLSTETIAAVQLELVQGVGGVRRIPDSVVRFLDVQRARRGYHLIFDETQTGMYRTGPFCAAQSIGVTPDLLVIGKGASDMMIPVALTLYSESIHRRVGESVPGMTDALHARHFHASGCRTLLNSLRHCEANEMSARVRDAGRAFAERLAAALDDCPTVRDIRVFGLLVGVELRTPGPPRGWRATLLSRLYLLGLLNHRPYPVIAGFCQFEPSVLKLTPPLTIETEEIDAACAAISSVLRKPLSRLAASAGLAWLRSRYRPFAADPLHPMTLADR